MDWLVSQAYLPNRLMVLSRMDFRYVFIFPVNECQGEGKLESFRLSVCLSVSALLAVCANSCPAFNFFLFCLDIDIPYWHKAIYCLHSRPQYDLYLWPQGQIGRFHNSCIWHMSVLPCNYDHCTCNTLTLDLKIKMSIINLSLGKIVFAPWHRHNKCGAWVYHHEVSIDLWHRKAGRIFSELYSV